MDINGDFPVRDVKNYQRVNWNYSRMGSVRFVSFSFSRNWLDVWRFVSWEPMVRFVSQRWSVRFVLFPFHRRFVTSVSSLEAKNTICWRRACGSGGLERIVDLRVCKSNVENAA